MLSSPLVEILGSAPAKVKLRPTPFRSQQGTLAISLPASLHFSQPPALPARQMSAGALPEAEPRRANAGSGTDLRLHSHHCSCRLRAFGGRPIADIDDFGCENSLELPGPKDIIAAARCACRNGLPPEVQRGRAFPEFARQPLLPRETKWHPLVAVAAEANSDRRGGWRAGFR
jgi:hypothetical protein